jgi:hypothetical protein
MDAMIPKRVRSVPNPDKAAILGLVQLIADRCPNSAAAKVFLRLSFQSASNRLECNLHVILACMADHEVEGVLNNGITDDERMALLELEDSGALDSHLAIAHGLLNIHERWLLMKSVSRLFREAVTRDGQYLSEPDLLSSILDVEGAADG